MRTLAGSRQTPAGKRQCREPEVNAVPGQKGELLFVYDSGNKVKWLVDSAALYSIVPPTPAQRTNNKQENHLQAANGTKFIAMVW